MRYQVLGPLVVTSRTTGESHSYLTIRLEVAAEALASSWKVAPRGHWYGPPVSAIGSRPMVVIASSGEGPNGFGVLRSMGGTRSTIPPTLATMPDPVHVALAKIDDGLRSVSPWWISMSPVPDVSRR